MLTTILAVIVIAVVLAVLLLYVAWPYAVALLAFIFAWKLITKLLNRGKD